MKDRSFLAFLLSLSFAVGVISQCQYNGYCSSPSQCCSGRCNWKPGDAFRTCGLASTPPPPTPQQSCESTAFKVYCTNAANGLTGCCNKPQETCCNNAAFGPCCALYG